MAPLKPELEKPETGKPQHALGSRDRTLGALDLGNASFLYFIHKETFEAQARAPGEPFPRSSSGLGRPCVHMLSAHTGGDFL